MHEEDVEDGWWTESMLSREQVLEARFGPTSPPDEVFKPESPRLADTVLPGFGFLRFPPAAERPYWLYITHGLSQPREESDFESGQAGGESGYGVEYALATSDEQSWPLRLLELITEHVLYSEDGWIVPRQRVPAPDLMEEARGGALLALRNPGYEPEVELLSGKMWIVHMVAITAGEWTRAQVDNGSDILECVLHRLGVGCVTDRHRRSLTDDARFETTWRDCANAS